MCIGLALSGLCCAGSAFCKQFCKCCKDCCKTGFNQQIRLAYTLITLLFMLFVVFVLHYIQVTNSPLIYYLQAIIEPFKDYLHCPAESGGQLVCFGVAAVYRMSFTLAIMFAFIFLSMFFNPACSKSINEGLWCLKVTFIIFFWICMHFIENDIFEGFADFAKYVSILYMIFQSIMLIDIFYMWGINWVKKYDDGEECMKYVLIITALILYTLSIVILKVLNVYNFYWFTGCGLNIFISIFNLVALVVITIIQVMGFNPHGSLITTGAQSLYMTFLTFAAQLSGPDKECSEIFGSSGVQGFELGIAFCLTILVLIYLTFGMPFLMKIITLGKREESSKSIVVKNGDAAGQLLASQDEEQDYDNGGKKQKYQDPPPNQQIIVVQIEQEDKELKPYKDNSFKIFHFIMLLTSIYSSMLITNWGSPQLEDSISDAYQPSQSSYWIKIIISWISAGIYIWTLIAPKIFKDRDFS